MKYIIALMISVGLVLGAVGQSDPCSLNTPNSLCNASPMPPPYSCPPGYVLNWQCMTECRADFFVSMAAARDTACGMLEAACEEQTQDISDCDQELTDCLDSGELPSVCIDQQTQCYEQAQRSYAAQGLAAEGWFNYQLGLAQKAYLDCIKDCCDQDV